MAIKPGALVAALDSALRHGGAGLKDIPDLVLKVIGENAWRNFETLRGDLREYASFPDFTEAELGIDVPMLRDHYCAGRSDAQVAIDIVLDDEKQPGRRTDLVYNIHKVDRPSGTSTAAALRRVRIRDPGLIDQVKAGTLTPHGAAVKAGLRPRTGTYRPDDPEYTARTLLKNMSSENITKLKELL